MHAYAKPPIPLPCDAQRFELPPGRLTWQGPFKCIGVVLDTVEFDFHIDVDPDYCPAVLEVILEQVQRLGFEPLDEDECEPELLPNGSTRIYLTPIIPVDDDPLIPAETAA